MKYYISDLHLQHENVLKYDDRPFSNIDAHDMTIINIINHTVWVDDKLYILGDISWKANKNIELLKAIQCKNVYFVQGNHDFTKYLKLYEELWRTNLWNMHIDKEDNVVLCHYPMEERFHSHHKEDKRFIHIHWHSHWNSMQRKWRIDVGLTFKDVTKPLSIEQIRNIIKDIDKWLKFNARKISWWRRFYNLFRIW